MEGAINDLFNQLISIGTDVGVTVCTFFLIWSAFGYMSAGGNVRQMESAKQGLVNALVGLAIILAARVIATMIQTALASAVHLS